MHISPNDHRKYRHIRLKNQINILLISDAQASKSAASLTVNVGHFSDPENREGLAHFLEHMLFLGTEKYPEPGKFQSFIKGHGGSNNAWTGTENTTYYFDVHHQYFSEALDRFSQFFISPLLHVDMVEKERNAIESEYRLKIKDDLRRIYDVKKETVNPQHPFRKFSVGDLGTLADRNGVSVREDLLTFYQENYSANIMNAAIFSSLSLDELENSAIEYFADIPNLNTSPNHPSVPLRESAQLQQCIYIEPIKDLKKLSLIFTLLNEKNLYKKKSLSFIAHLIGDESEGSLVSFLKNKNWINYLSAGGGLSGSTYREFVISIDLTPEGLEHLDQIIAYVFQTIELIKEKGVEKWRYDEKKAVYEMAYQYKESIRPLDTVNHLVMNMQYFDKEDILRGDYMMSGFDENEIRFFLSLLKPENLCVIVTTKDSVFEKTSYRYATPYSQKPFTTEQLNLWNRKNDETEISLSNPNAFICDELSLEPLSTPYQYLPTKLIDNAGFSFWHLQESEFYVPKGIVYFSIDSPFAVSSVENIVKMSLCVDMLMDSLGEIAYPAEIAGLSYNISTHQGGVTVKLSGFTPKLPTLLEVIINKFKSRSFKKERFENRKSQLLKYWNNGLKEKPISLLFNKLLSLLQSNNPPLESCIEALEAVTHEELPDFVMKFLSKIHINCFVYGNWQQDQANLIAQQIKSALYIDDQEYQKSEKPLWLIKNEKDLVYEYEFDSDDSALVVYYQAENTSAQDIAYYSFSHHLISAIFFNELRTKQQLGYMVGSSYQPLNKYPGLLFYIQSNQAEPKLLLKAVNEFLNNFFLILLEQNEMQWLASKQGIIAKIKEPDANLRARGQRFWQSINSPEIDFSIRDKIIAAIETMSRGEMLKFVVDKLKPRTANRLILHCTGLKHRRNKKEE